MINKPTTFLINSGHGSDTLGKRSPFVPPGIKEWEFNRDIARRLVAATNGAGLIGHNYLDHIDPEQCAVPLHEIVRRVNAHRGQTVLLSIHANAARDGDSAWVDNAHGSAAFVATTASARSHSIALTIAPWVATSLRIKNRGIIEKDFTVLKKTFCPAILLECGFMTNSSEATKLASHYWRGELARTLTAFIRNFKWVDHG